MKYEVTIFDDGEKLLEIEHFLKKARVKFDTERIENDYACKGVEFLGFQIKLSTLDERIVDTLSKIWLDAYVTAHKVNFKKFYSIRWKRRKSYKPAVDNYYFKGESDVDYDIPF